MPYTPPEVSRLVAEIRRPFLQGYSGTMPTANGGDQQPFGTEGRDQVWDRRRNTRHRRSSPWLPSNFGIQNANIRYRDSLPEFVINRIKQRLGANDFKMAMHVPGDAGPTLRRRAEQIEDFLRGSWSLLDPTNSLHRRIREHLAADGRGWLEFECLPDYMPPPRGDLSETQYDELVINGQRDHGLPVRALAPDGRSLYYPIGERISMVCKVVNRQLIDVQDNWNAEGFRLVYKKDQSTNGGSIEQMPILAGEQSPAVSAADYGQMVRIVRLATDNDIYDLCYPSTAPAGSYGGGMFGDSAGAVPQLIMLGHYHNPFGRPPFFFATARNTSDPNPAYSDYPLALELLELAEQMNQVMSIRQLKAFMQALMPTQYQPLGENTGSAAPKRVEGLISPGFLEASGRFYEIPTPQAPDFEKLIEFYTKTQAGFNTGVMGALQNGNLGKSTPAWTTLQMNEEQVAFIQEALDSMASMRKEASMALLNICAKKAKDGPLYIRTERRSRKEPSANIDVIHTLKAEDFDGPFRLTVTIDALTQSQRAARTEYGRRLYEEGSISKQTYLEEYVGIDDVEQEMARQRREMLMAPLEKAAQLLGLQKAANEWYALIGDPIIPILQAVGLPMPQSAPGGQPAMPPAPGAGAAPSAMGDELASGPAAPGQGLSIQQPDLNQAVRSMAEPVGGMGMA